MAAHFYSLEDLSHDTKLAEALGNMVVAWAYAEQRLLGTLARITGTGLNMCLAGCFRIPTFEARTKFVLALITEWRTTEFDRENIAKAVEKLSKLASARNHWIHGDWCANRGKTITVIFNHRVPIESPERRKPVKAADVLNHCAAVRARAETLARLIRYDSLEG
jgi:hypothetical protein